MKTHLLLFLLLFFSINIFAQSYNFDKDYNKLLKHLEQESWTKAYDQAAEIKANIADDKSYVKANKVVNYILIYTTAGMMNDKELTQEEALKQVDYLVGEIMTMPAHPFLSNYYTNCTSFGEDSNTFSSVVNNINGTCIFCIEVVEIDGPIKESAQELEEKLIILEGKLDKIEVSGMMLPKFNLKFTDGSYKVIYGN